MGTVLNLAGLSGDFRYKVLKPMFVNFLMATNVFDMPAALFSRYLEFFDIESVTPMRTWDQGTRRIYDNLTAGFRDRIHLSRPVRKVYRYMTHVVVEDEEGTQERFDDVVFACNANQTLMMLDRPTLLERYILSSVRYESELHNHTVVHSDASVLPDNEGQAARDAEQPHRAVRSAPGQLRDHLHHAQPAAVGGRFGQAMPGHLQPDHPDRRG